MEQRTRTLEMPCPRCGGVLQALERPISVEEEGGGIRWTQIRSWCSTNHCPLTSEDFK